MDDSLLPFTSLRENLIQAYLDFSYFRTMEPKLTPALRKMPITDLRHTIGTGDLFHKQTSIYRGNSFYKSISSSTGQWSEPKISVWIFAPVSLSLSRFDVIK